MHDILPLVSIIIPCHNYGHLIEETIQSVQEQTYKNIELIIINDESTDNTEAVLQKHPQIKHYTITHKGKKTPAHASNIGLKYASGKYIIFLGADDKLYPKYIEECYAEYVRQTQSLHKKIGLIWTSCQKFGNSTELCTPKISVTHSKYDFFENPDGQLGAMFVPKQVYNEVGVYDTNLDAAEDWDMAIRILFKGYKAASIAKPLHLCRVHNLNIHDLKTHNFALKQLKNKYPLMQAYRTARYVNLRIRRMIVNPKGQLLRTRLLVIKNVCKIN